MLAGVGVVAVSVGAYNAAQGDSAAHAVGAYYVNGAAPTGAEASTLRWLEERAETLSSLGLGLMVGGGVAIALGVSMILLDGWLGDTKVSLAIAPGRASVLVSGTF